MQEFTYEMIKWNGPYLVESYDFSAVSPVSGVYVFSESMDPLRPNPFIPPCGPERASALELVRSSPCILYVGMSVNLQRRLPGYKFRPYLEIKRRPKGTPPRHIADRHRGRALLHAQQFFHYEGLEPLLYLRWAHVGTPRKTEAALIRELRPCINARGIPISKTENDSRTIIKSFTCPQ